MTLVCDTSVVFATLDAAEKHHHACVELIYESEPVVVPAPVLVELDYLARTRRAPQAIDAVLASIEDGSVVIASLDFEDYVRVRTLVSQYADFPLSFVDAAVVAIAERLEQTTIATLDRRHFSVVRPLHVPAFELVP